MKRNKSETVHEMEDEQLSEFSDPDLHGEAINAKAEQMSASSFGSAPGEEGGREHNPFMKAISSNRKDFKYVTALRKEVIQIVEPFRAKVLTFEDRIKFLEKWVVENSEHQKDEEAKVQHRMN